MEERSQLHVHVLDVVQKAVSSVHPPHQDDFKEGNQQQIPRSTLGINQSEHVESPTRAHAQST